MSLVFPTKSIVNDLLGWLRENIHVNLISRKKGLMTCFVSSILMCLTDSDEITEFQICPPTHKIIQLLSQIMNVFI